METLIAMAVFSFVAAALFTTWNAIGTATLNTTTYSGRQNDQMRVFDYLKRDIRRATSITITESGIPVTGNNFGTVLQLTIPDYYTDSREEDNAIGLRVASTPTLSGGNVAYGGNLTVRYYTLDGAVIRSESGVLRTVADASGSFSISFSNDASELIRCRLLFNQPLRGSGGRTLRRRSTFCVANARSSGPKNGIMTIRSSGLAIRHREAGSALLAALAILAVVLAAAGATLFEASHRYRTSNQSSRWAQAEQAAEAGAEIALLTAQKSSWVTDGWSGAPGPPGAVPVTKTVALDNGVPATGPINTAVSVDKVTMGGAAWLRIRSRGIANLSGSSREGVDTKDITLRKLTLQIDRVTGALVPSPRAIRTVEILAQPTSPYDRAILLNKRFNMSGGGTLDSFDSSDPAKSTGGLYDASKKQTNGNVGVNDTENASDLKNTFVYGSIDYSGAPIDNTGNVQGTITSGFSRPVSPVTAPSWPSYNPSPSIINGTTTLTGGTQSAPARYQVSSVTVSAGKVLTIAPLVAGEESYIEIWVTGDFTTSGSGYVLEKPGVHVTYYIAGDVTVSGDSFNNQSNIAANNIINLINPPVGTSQKVTVSGSGTFIGAINAPGADFTISGSGNLSGALIGKTMNISDGASVHFDEALGNITGNGCGYRVASWVEAVR